MTLKGAIAGSEDFFCTPMNPKIPSPQKEIEKLFTKPISAKDIQMSMNHLCNAESALQIGKLNKTVIEAKKHIHSAHNLLRKTKR